MPLKIWVISFLYLDIELVKRKLFSCEADLKHKEEELRRNKNLAILKSKYARERLIVKKLAFKVCESRVYIEELKFWISFLCNM